ncbi:MAG: SPASM domain-containing protein [Candidatus Omnitrophica bacterium]|nr:SPASM domain-containing protein [Candidatus Omnitrophota bacterium]MDD5671517.1 SPASM domain-containing protein [Candidatus Omnitrophota bacterium]
MGKNISLSNHVTFYKKRDALSCLNVDISGLCQLNCKMCSFQKWYGEKGIMSLETFKMLRAVLKKIKNIELQANCEPLLNNQIIECIKFTKTINRKIRIRLVTNGMLLTPFMIAQLLKAGVHQISVSMDGATKKTYERIRQGANFEKAITNIKELVRQQKSRQNALPMVELLAVASKINVQELPKILDLAKTLEIKNVSINGLEPYSRAMAGKKLYVRPGEKVDKKCAKIFADMRQKASRYKIKLKLPSLTAIPYFVCEMQGCVVHWNGFVSPCPLLSYERPYWYFGRKYVHPRVVFGNIHKKNLLDIWRSREYEAFRSRLRSGHLPEYCSRCLLQQRVLCV